MRYSTFNFPRHIQREEKGGFDPGAWDGIGDATANHEDITQIETKSQKDEEEEEEVIDEVIDDETKVDEEIKDDESSDDESKEEKEEGFDLSEEESKRIEDEIKDKSEKEGDDLDKEIKDAQKDRLDSLVKDQDSKDQSRFDKKIKELQDIKENKEKTDDELTKLANNAIKEENDNPFFIDESEDSSSETINDWQEIGKEIVIDGESIEVKDNTQESFQEAVNEQIDIIKAENQEYSDLSQDMKDAFRYANENGMDALENWLHPDKTIESYLKLPNDQLMETAINASRKQAEPKEEIDAEDVKQEIVDMKEDGSYAKNLRNLKTNLRVKLDEARTTVIDRNNREKASLDSKKEEGIDKIHNKLVEELEGMDKFLDTYEIPKKTINDLVKGLTPDSIKRLQTDPKILAITAIMHKFGPKLIKGMTESAASKSKDRSLKIKRNADSALLVKRVSTSSSAGASSESDEKKGFGKWKI